MKKKPKISIIIPTLNEEKTLGTVIRKIKEINLPPYEIIVVDGYSTDRTVHIAKKYNCRVIMEKRKGYGRALLTGMKHAKGDILVWIDGDNTYPPKYIPELINPIIKSEADFVISSRIRGKIYSGAMSKINLFGNILLTLIFDILYFQRISDSQCGLRAISKRVINAITLESHGMELAIETLIKASLSGFRIKEGPKIEYLPRVGQSKLNPLCDGFRILKTLLYFRLKKL